MNPLLDLKYRLEYALLRGLMGFVRLFPLETATEMFARMLRTLAPRTRRHRRALENLAIAFPDKPREEHERIARAMWDNAGRVVAETMQIDRLLAQPERIEIADDFFVRRYKGKLGPIVCASMHMGNWELATWPLVLCDIKTVAVYRLVKNPYVDSYLRSMRQRLYPGGLYAKGRAGGRNAGYDAARVLSNYARQGGRLAFLADLYDKNGIPVPFFGRDARSAPFPAMLARRAGARMWVGTCTRIGRESRFRVAVKELKVPRTADAEADVAWLTAAIQAQFEAWIRETPEQYMWSNRRFA